MTSWVEPTSYSLGDTSWNRYHGNQVLEAGCGAGCFTEILLERGAYVTSIDSSEAIEANQEKFLHYSGEYLAVSLHTTAIRLRVLSRCGPA